MPKEKPIEGIDPKIAVDWGLPEDENPVRNTVHRYIKFKDSTVFSPAANFFRKHNCYTLDLEGTLDYEKFWDEEERRCIEGYEVGGVRVTGRHYFYLNYCIIKLIPTDSRTGKITSKTVVRDFPRFLDHNYYYLLEIERCMAEGPWKMYDKIGNVVTKGRRKGHTYIISGAIFAYNYTFLPDSMSMLAAGEKSHYKITLDGIHDSISNITEHTVWGKKRLIAQRDHIKSGFMEQNDKGMYIEKGYKSEVRAISFADNPFKSIGECSTVVAFEEAGKFDGLLKAIGITEATYRNGDVMIGIPIVYGTGGQMEKSTKDLHEIFYNPSQFLMQAYDNIYDNNAIGTCGYFIDSAWFYMCTTKEDITINGELYPKGTLGVDPQGNSNRRVAMYVIEKEREARKGNRKSYNDFLTQFPLTPAEAFLKTAGTMFDTVAAQMRLGTIESQGDRFKGSVDIGTIEFTDLSTPVFRSNRNLVPLHEFPLKDCLGKYGALEIYEHPIKSESFKIPYRYIAGIDSYDFDTSTTNSVGSMVVFDRVTDRIVAHYKGRPERAQDFHEGCRRILAYYGATANFENANIGIFDHFEKKKSAQMLCDCPEVIKVEDLVKHKTTGNRKKGTPPTTPVKVFGLNALKKWLETKATGEPEDSEITNVMTIKSIGILKEIIAWEEVGNYDDISALIMLFVYREDLTKIKTTENKVTKNIYNDPYFKKKIM